MRHGFLSSAKLSHMDMSGNGSATCVRSIPLASMPMTKAQPRLRFRRCSAAMTMIARRVGCESAATKRAPRRAITSQTQHSQQTPYSLVVYPWSCYSKTLPRSWAAAENAADSVTPQSRMIEAAPVASHAHIQRWVAANWFDRHGPASTRLSGPKASRMATRL